MEKLILSAICITVAFLAVKYVEKKILRKKPDAADEDESNSSSSSDKVDMKDTFRDAIVVFICSILCLFTIEQVWPLLQSTFDGIATGEIMETGPPKVFGGQPDF